MWLRHYFYLQKFLKPDSTATQTLSMVRSRQQRQSQFHGRYPHQRPQSRPLCPRGHCCHWRLTHRSQAQRRLWLRNRHPSPWLLTHKSPALTRPLLTIRPSSFTLPRLLPPLRLSLTLPACDLLPRFHSATCSSDHTNSFNPLQRPPTPFPSGDSLRCPPVGRHGQGLSILIE